MASKKLFFVILIALASIAGAFTVYSYQGNYKHPLLIFPKGSSYEKEWKKVDSLSNKGLTKSALEVVTGIYNKAKTESNSAQFVKAIIHRMKFEQKMEEYSLEKALNSLNEEAKEATFPVKPILHSMIAESYWQYYQNNRWKFYNRTTTVNFDNSDITTWDLKTIFDQVIKNYQASLQNTDSLKRTPLNIYDEVLVKYDYSRKFRPTLYDFLAHRAVDFYMNEEPDITRPAYKFELNSESYFWNFNDFSKLNIESKDTLSLKYYAIKTLQELIAFHSKDENPQALIDVDLKRLLFVKNKSVSDIKDSLYLGALQDLEKQFSSKSSSADVSYKIASVHFEKGNKYNALQSDENKWMKRAALELCEATIKKFPESEGAKDCKALSARITERVLHFITEKVNLPFKPLRTLVTYKNLKTVYVRIAEMDIDKYNRSVERYYGEDLMKQYLKLKSVKEFAVQLPDDGDYQSHSVEIKLPELKLGHYVILMASDSGFSYKNNGISYAGTWISNISYVNRRMENGSYDFYVQHRLTGEPLKGVTAQLYYEKYNYTSRKYEYVRSEKHVSDEKGYFNVPPIEDYRNFSVDFTYKYDLGPTFLEDKLQTDNGIYQYKTYKEEKRKYPKTFFFLDRGIYRPGQTVYFKGIMINTDGETNEIMANETSTVTFYDVNHQKVGDLHLTTNEYGTFNGSFTAPNGVLNGQMSIGNGSGTAYFSVEEYKRPKFEVSFKPVEGSYRLGENIKVTGNALAYSGAKIDGAEVKFRIVRNASFPYWWYWWRGYYPQSAQMEIVNGVTVSNDTGAFFIDFKAIPDLSIPKSYQPTYSYTVFADVTDINGETHSSQTYVNAAYTALNLNVSLPAMLEKNNREAFAIYTTNMSGQSQTAAGKVEIYKLKEPDKTYRARIWPQPDKFIMNRQEFELAFPNDEYKDENNMYKWERAEKVFEKEFKNIAKVEGGAVMMPGKNDSVRINNLELWKQGVYVMEAHSKDAYGEDVKDVKYFTVYSDSESTVPSNKINWFNMITNGPLEPGEKAKFVIGTKEENVKVLYEIEHKGKIVKQEFITLNKEQKLIEIPVEEKHRGNFAFHLLFVKNNRSYVNNGIITVPYTNKELDIQFETFRNKLQPGQQEEWKVKIKDKKGEKMAAEMMATLYDASLDAFRPNNWYFNVYNSYYSNMYWDANHAFGMVNAQLYSIDWNKYPSGSYKYYDRLNWFGYRNGYHRSNNYNSKYYYEDGNAAMSMDSKSTALQSVEISEEKSVDESESSGKDKSRRTKKESSKNAEGRGDGESLAEADSDMTVTGGVPASYGDGIKSGEDLSKVSARSNFAETAFFYPQMETDKDGSIIIKFTIPEALTKWKMMGLAHTKDLKFGMIEKELQTQKDLMVIPNAPRFFRENDKMEFSAKISNLSDKDLNGTAQLFLYDATTMKDITKSIITEGKESTDQKSFTSKKGQSAAVSWSISVPEGIGAITYKVVAKAGNFTDGEEMAVPVLTNRMLVTETLPLPIRGLESHTYLFEKLITQSNNSTTLRNHKLTLEFTSNPAWYAVQSLPYLMEYPYECAEQTFSRFYANSIASHIANSSPKIKAVFDSWKNAPDSKALLSNLEKNQELKSLMLEETPWVLDAKDETERKKRVALLFDLNKMSSELVRALKKLEKMQVSNGGWPWFDGMPDDRYITQHIVTGMGHLDRLGVKNVRADKDVWKMVKDGARYLDNRIREDYEWILKHDKAHIDENHLGYLQIQYLYARSYFKDVPIDNRNQKAFDYYKGQAKKYWLSNSRYMQGMIALALHRYDDKSTAMGIIKSLKENALYNEEMGMYWSDNYEGYYWYQAPIEAQALLIEAFDEVANDKKSVDDLKVWLLKSKQTQDWKTTKATTEACYALLLRGTDWLATESNVEIVMGNVKVDPKNLPDTKQEAGTGYFKTSWSGGDIKPEMGKITITKRDEGVSWGSVYWQYFEQLDKITPAKTPLSLKKQLFLQKNTDAGPVIEPITEKTMLKVGDKIKVRIELRVDRDMEYVQMKDMRASGFEPTNVISSYKWQGGLGYYESTRDAATNFFFSYLPKGTYVFEYPLVVSHNGNFSNGITSIQCMYAPEFSSHSEGIRVKVGK
jgi:uncharacterized protein YfaS (alpha-2-macroglobulin family)